MALVIVLPTRNEAPIIRANLAHLVAFINASIREECRIIVADNASTDATREIVRDVTSFEPRVELLEIPTPGKGGAVLAAWKRSDADIYVFMDADLATDLAALPHLISAIRDGADVTIGSRYLPGSRTQRGLLRRVTSRCYRTLLRLLFGLRVTDPPCGFKAVSARVVRDIVPRIHDMQWFFDTELCIRAQRAGLRIAEIPVTWHEPRHGRSFAKVIRIIMSDLRTMWRLS